MTVGELYLKLARVNPSATIVINTKQFCESLRSNYIIHTADIIETSFSKVNEDKGTMTLTIGI